jgi:hypothetical protein
MIPLRVESIDAGKQSVEAVTYKGRKAIRFMDRGQGDGQLAMLKDTDFHNGTLEVDIAAAPSPGAMEGARGFAGLAFRIKERGNYEAFYIRPTNGRADDQLRRNHSTQYVSEPEWTWQRLRTEAPGVYESYVDLVPGEWTHLKVVVAGLRGELYVNGAAQPCLIVKDLKKGDRRGSLALWIGIGTDAYFADLKVTPAP